MVIRHHSLIETPPSIDLHLDLAARRLNNLIIWPGWPKTEDIVYFSWRIQYPDLTIASIYCINSPGREGFATSALHMLPGPERLVLYARPTQPPEKRIGIPKHFKDTLLQLEEINVEGSGDGCRPLSNLQVCSWSLRGQDYQPEAIVPVTGIRLNFTTVSVVVVDCEMDLETPSKHEGSLPDIHTLVMSLRSLTTGFSTNVELPSLRRIVVLKPSVIVMEEWDRFLSTHDGGHGVEEVVIESMVPADALNALALVRELLNLQVLGLVEESVKPIVLLLMENAEEALLAGDFTNVMFPRLKQLALTPKQWGDQAVQGLIQARRDLYIKSGSDVVDALKLEIGLLEPYSRFELVRNC